MNERVLDKDSARARNGGPLQGEGAYTRLMEEIQSGALKPGDRLTETELADRLATSRTPVREAIRRLEADGLVTHMPRVGAVVRKLSYSEIMELYEMRIVFEGTAARLAARSASDVEIAEIAAINKEMAEAADKGDSDRVFEVNRQFHAAIIDSARNRYLVKSVQSVQTTLLILGPSTLTESARASAVVNEHEAVVGALQERNELAAEAAMRQHMENAQRTRLRFLRETGMLSDPYPPEAE